MHLRLSDHTVRRLEAVRDQIAPLMDRGTLAPEQIVNLLLDHWQSGYPPQAGWVKGQANLYPGAGGRKTKWSDR